MPPPLFLLAAALLAGGALASSGPIAPTSVTVVSASACAGGQARRPCTELELVGGGRRGHSATCPCPYIDGVTGGPGPLRRFALEVRELLLPSLVPGLTKVHVTANGTIPGPPIVVDEGDWVEVSVTNLLPSTETTIHWHGQLQVMTPFQDGVPSMTQCAILPGNTLVYAFRAAVAGTFWYHGHMGEQTVDGLFGLLQVRAAPGSPQDLTNSAAGATDSEAFIFLSDYYNNNAHDLLSLFYLTPEAAGVEPIPDAINANGRRSGALFMPVPSRSSKTLVHVISAAALSMFRVSIDGVNLQVVELDSTAVVPLTVPSVVINIAQRVSFVVDWSALSLPPGASAGAGVYFRATAMTDMYAIDTDGYVPPYEASILVNPPAPLDPNFTAIFQFAPIAPDGTGAKLPDYAANGSFGVAPVAPPIAAPPASSPYAGLSSRSLDTNLLDAVPVVPLQAPPGTHQLYLEVAFFADNKTGNVNRGHMNGISHVHNAVGGMMPTLYDWTEYGTPDGTASIHDPLAYPHSAFKPFGYAASGAPLPLKPIAFSEESHYLLPPGAVIVMLINNTDEGEHPFYLHGHTVWVVATSERPVESPARAAANTIMRRDTVSVAGNGWAKVVFVAENPGIWAVHCHNEWHLAAGLMVEFFEGLSSLDGMPTPDSQRQNCNLPQPGASSWVFQGSTKVHVDNTVVSSSACALGQDERACTFNERNSPGLNNSTRCHCNAGVEDDEGGVGPIREFTLVVQQLVAPEPLVPGAKKVLYTVNGASPGPTIEVREGEWVSVTIKNEMSDDSTVVQFQGMDFVLTPFSAGVPTISQCTILPGLTFHVGFRATRAGVFMYRGTFNMQDVDGLVGALIIRPRLDAPPASLPPPASSEFVLFLGEHYVANAHSAVDSFFLTPASNGVPPVPNALTVNGKTSRQLSLNAASRGAASLLHLVGAHALSVLDVSVDGVALQVVAVDGTALARPYLSLSSVAVAAGQRVSVLVDWSTLPPFTPGLGAPAGQGVFLRVRARTDVFGVPSPATWINPLDVNVPGIAPLDPLCLVAVRFGGAPGVLPAYNASGPGVPATPASALAPADANLLDARPAIAVAPPAATHELYLEFGPLVEAATGETRGAVNGATFSPVSIDAGGLVPIVWRYQIFGEEPGSALATPPEAFPVAARGSAAAAAAAGITAAAPTQAVGYNPATSQYLLPPNGSAVVLVLVNNTFARERPVRADGHNFFVLATSDAPGAEAAYAGAWLRRDVVSVPARGWARLLFVGDNPGVWRLSSASPWHVANGESILLYEALANLEGLDVPVIHRDVCGMPSLGSVPSPSPSPRAVVVQPAPPATLTTAQLIAVVTVPILLLTLVGRLAVPSVESWLSSSGAGTGSGKVRPV